MNGKKVLITGAGSGIGRATAKMLAARGAQVALLGRSRSELGEVFDEIGGSKAGHLVLAADVSDKNQMTLAFEELASVWEELDVTVANAGINGVWAPLHKIEPEEWDETLGVNLRGTFLTVRGSLPFLRRSGGGSVVIVSSINGTRIFSNSGATAYACSKAGQVAFAKMTALELAADKIRVNVVCPGAITTNIDDSAERRSLEHLHLPVEFPQGDVPLTDGPPGSAEQVACAICFLASDDSSHISGTELYIDGGQSLLQG